MLLGILDLSTSFYTVDQDVLLKRLKISYGVTRAPFQWLNSYLAGRVQITVINRSRSLAIKLSCGVPQGSVLGLILFVIYTKTSVQLLSVMISEASGDTQVYFYCKPNEVDSLARKFAVCSDKLCTWMRSNRLKLNADKTECIWVTMRQ